MKKEITQEYLKQIFDYKDGELYWKINKSNGKIKVGDKVGRKNINVTDDRNYVGIDYKTYLLSRIIFMWHHGFLPKMVDHINGNKQDNHIENLRASDECTNQYNRGLPKNNTSGIKNVSWNSSHQAWEISINKNKKKVFGTYVKDIELAELIAIEIREKFHGEYARHN